MDGKTTLFKAMLLQALLKNERAIIIDMKFGLDFNKGWKELCEVITDIDKLWDFLHYDIKDICNERIGLLEKYKCSSFKEYNEKVKNGEIQGKELQRIIIGIDEAAQLFPKTSSDKEKRQKLEDIREKIDEIASLYRALGVSLVISTQVPSADVLSSAVRYNSVLKICGRANELLSKMTLDTTLASTIPKSSRGRFVTNEGDFFQGYLFYEEKVFPKIIEQRKQKEQKDNTTQDKCEENNYIQLSLFDN